MKGTTAEGLAGSGLMASGKKRDAIEAAANAAVPANVAVAAVAEAATASKKKPAFDAQALLDSAGVSRGVVEFRRAEAVFSQGDPAKHVIIDKNEMLRVLHAEHDLPDRFISHVLARNIRIEEDSVDQLFNSSEKQLARKALAAASVLS